MFAWKNLLVISLVSLMIPCAAVTTKPQKGDPATDSAAATAAGSAAVLQNAAQKGFPMPVVASVSNSASIQAVLIPADLAKRIFGKEVAKNYAVVELIVSNEDANAALVVHSVFLDDSEWLLRGRADCAEDPPTRLTTAQKANLPCQIASIESRLVRGELLDAQPGTSRNWTMRSLVAAGSVAAGFAFPFSGDVAKGIAAFNGVVVPGAATLWPDGTINQINHISDFGFQTNKIIPKQSSDVIVAFFPIRRFLTPSFRKLFLKDPAALFVPGELVADPIMARTVMAFMGPFLGIGTDSSKLTGEALYAGRANALKAINRNCESWTELGSGTTTFTDLDRDCKLQKFINGVSLNNIRVVIEGAMTVDVATIPATVYSVSFDATDLTKLWGTLKTDEPGTIAGVYLTGGVPSAVDSAGNAIKGITMTAVASGSSDTLLHFTMKLTSCISPPDGPISIVVAKPQDSSNGAGKDSKAAAAAKPGISVTSTPFQLLQQPVSACAVAAPAAPAAPAAAAASAAAGNKATQPTVAKPKPD